MAPRKKAKIDDDGICQHCFDRKKVYDSKSKLWVTCQCVIDRLRNEIVDNFNGIKPANRGFFLDRYKNCNSIFYCSDKNVFWRHLVHLLMFKVPLRTTYEIVTAYELIDVGFDKHTKFQSYNDLYKFDILIVELEMVFQNKNMVDILEQVIGSRTSRKKITWFLSRHNEYFLKERFTGIRKILEHFKFEEFGEKALS